MKVFALITLAGVAATVTPAFAQSQGYVGSSGMNYQYDLSSPTGQIGYSVDPQAQIRDTINVDPRRQIDQGIGQYGGGAYNLR